MEKVLNINSKFIVLSVLVCSLISHLKANTVLDQSAFLYEDVLYTLYDVKPYLIVQQRLQGKDKVTLGKQEYKAAIDTMIQNFVVLDYLDKVSIINQDSLKEQEKRFEKLVDTPTLNFIKNQGQTKEAVKKAFFQEYNKEKFVRDSIAFRARVSDKEAVDYYDENQKDFLSQNKEEAIKKIKISLMKQQLVVEYKEWLARQVARKKIYLFPLSD